MKASIVVLLLVVVFARFSVHHYCFSKPFVPLDSWVVEEVGKLPRASFCPATISQIISINGVRVTNVVTYMMCERSGCDCPTITGMPDIGICCPEYTTVEAKLKCVKSVEIFILADCTCNYPFEGK